MFRNQNLILATQAVKIKVVMNLGHLKDFNEKNTCGDLSIVKGNGWVKLSNKFFVGHGYIILSDNRVM